MDDQSADENDYNDDDWTENMVVTYGSIDQNLRSAFILKDTPNLVSTYIAVTYCTLPFITVEEERFQFVLY